MSTGQKRELTQVLIAVSQVYAPACDRHETWDYKKIYSDIVWYIFSITVEKSVTEHCWKPYYEEWTVPTWFKAILWVVLESPAGIKGNALYPHHLSCITKWMHSANEPQTENIH